MSAVSDPLALVQAMQRSGETWQSDLHEMFKCARDRFPDILWEQDEDGISDVGDKGEIWGHKAIVYARAPPSWQAKYFLFRPGPIGFTNQSRSPSPLPPPPTKHLGLLRLPTINPATFPGELEHLYTARGLSRAFEFLFDEFPVSREGDEDETRLERLREDLVFMWRSHLYSDIKISLTNTLNINHENATTVFSSHRFILVSRSQYFHTSLKGRDNTANAIVKAAPGSGEVEPLTVDLPSPPFTPASLHFTLGYMYAGTLIFSNETYDLETAFQIMRSATYLSIRPLFDEIQARIVQEMMHGLFNAFLEFSEYERITGGKWSVGGCRCRQCARRAPRVLEFAIAEDVRNQYLERGARRALVGLYGEGWCTSEFSKLPEEIKLQLIKGLAKRTTPTNIFPLLFATHQALRKLNNISDLWSDGIRELLQSTRKSIDEVLCKQAEECFEQPEWIEIMIEDGSRLDDVNKVRWVMESIRRGLNDLNAPLVYQTLVSSILMRQHPIGSEHTMLSLTSRIRVRTEETRLAVARWLRLRWTGVKQAGGFDKLEDWSLRELSYELDVSTNDLLNPMIPGHSPHKSVLINERTTPEESDSGSMHSTRTNTKNGKKAQLQETLANHERVQTPATSAPSTSPRTPSNDGMHRESMLSIGSRPDPKLAPASTSIVSSTRPVLSTEKDSSAMLTKVRSAPGYVPRSPVVRIDLTHASELQEGSTSSGADSGVGTPEHSHMDSTLKSHSRSSSTTAASPTFRTVSNSPSSNLKENSTTQSIKLPRNNLGASTVSTVGTGIHEPSFGDKSSTTQPTPRHLSHEVGSLIIQQPEVPAEESSVPTLMNRQQTPASVPEISRQLAKLIPSDNKYRRLLLELLNHRDLKLYVQDLQEDDLRGFVELLDNALNHIQATDDLFRKTLRRLQNVCSNRRILPSSYLIPSGDLLNRGEPFAAGRFANVHQAEFNRKRVCIKVLRSYSLDASGVINKVFYAEVVVWKRLKHPNIVPFLGVPTETPPPFEIVCDWMENGRVTEYVKKYPQVDRVGLLWDVVDGLHHLHSCEIIHGDLKGANILVDNMGRARLADFGLTSIIRGDNSTRVAQDPDIVGMTTWAAPEILRGGAVTKEGDIFTFAMVVVETFTGRTPFATSYQVAIFDVMAGKRPGRPETLNHDDLWKLTQTCWAQDPGQRLTTSKLLKSFRALFPRERGSPKVAPSPPPACTSPDPEIRMDENTKSRSPLSEQIAMDMDVSEPQDTFVVNPQVAQPEPLIPAWKYLISCPLPMDKRISLVTTVFSDREEVRMVNHIYGDDAQAFVDVIDETLDMLVPQLQRNCLDTLRKICGRQGLLPRSVQIQLGYSRSDTPLYQGGYADVWKSQYQNCDVAVKVLRVCSTDDFKKVTSRFCKEVITWKALCHPNVLPLLGVMMGDRHFVMVSKWMDNGNINEFIKANQDVNRFELLKDITRGLIYMHNREMIHGDLKGANILINKNCHACLADFGLLTLISDPTYATSSSSKLNSGTVPWMSPELLYPERYGLEDSQPTKESDYYALGMVIFEVLSGKPPFAGYKGFIVTRKVIEGEHPERHKSPWFTDDLWETLKKCWSSEPKDRPMAEAILQFLDNIQMA